MTILIVLIMYILTVLADDSVLTGGDIVVWIHVDHVVGIIIIVIIIIVLINRNMSKSKGWTLQSSLLTLWMEKTRVNNQTKIEDDENLLKTL